MDNFDDAPPVKLASAKMEAALNRLKADKEKLAQIEANSAASHEIWKREEAQREAAKARKAAQDTATEVAKGSESKAPASH